MTVDDIKQYAQVMELHCIEYLDVYGARTIWLSQVRFVRIQFIDGNVSWLTTDEFAQLNNVYFKLRPARNNA